MTDGQIALKAAKAALVAIAVLVSVGGTLTALLVGSIKLFGPRGAVLFYAGLVFLIFWLCAALDIVRKEDRDASGMPSEGPRREGGSGASAPASPVPNGETPK